MLMAVLFPEILCDFVVCSVFDRSDNKDVFKVSLKESRTNNKFADFQVPTVKIKPFSLETFLMKSNFERVWQNCAYKDLIRNPVKLA